MNIRRAEEKDINKIIDLLQQVLQIHAQGRSDIFIAGSTKYTNEELAAMVVDEEAPIFVAVNDQDEVLGYAMTVFEYSEGNNLHPMKSLYIDDLCVDESCRGMHIGEALFDYVSQYAKDHDCYRVTLNVWEFNHSARKFYEKQGLKPLKTILEKVL